MSNRQEVSLIVVNTNSARDSKGTAFGLDGDLFLYLLGGAIASLLTCSVMIALHINVFASIVVGLVPIALAGLYLKVFRINRPPHYQEDLIDYWLHGSGCEKQGRGMSEGS